MGGTRRTPALMLQGTGSHVGKSLLVAGLCRAYTRADLRVRPFKPQNMSNNAAVTADGGEIGRAQALQARACLVPASVDMNPVLLKPQSEIGAQLVVQGRAEGVAAARDYHALKARLLPRVLDSFARIAADADLVVVEGAGSPAEINLREGDIANMGFAEAADVPVVLVGDIDRGGVIASLVGTVALLAAPERARLKGFIVNKFRGDPALFDSGLAAIAERTLLPSLGLVPWFAEAARLPAEDAVGLDGRAVAFLRDPDRPIRVAVARLPRIANFDDLDPLAAEPDVALILVTPGQPLPGDADLVILPGSKATRADLDALREAGWDIDLRAHLRRGGRVLGLCGGYQMLGRRIADPDGIEGPAGESPGLGLLDVETVLAPAKTLREIRGRDALSGEALNGYEMHMGATAGPDCARPMLRPEGRSEGARSADGRIEGCYLHGLFATDGYRRAYLNRLRVARGLDAKAGGLAYDAEIDAVLDRLAAHLKASLDLDRILEIARAR
ncbi:MAG: cobyric acid synthase [Proteobacteria bacterium]|nr:cobyric acid synthase [Pseudomonadota bacterium]